MTMRIESDTAQRFWLERDVDPTGISGTGKVADGVVFPDGSVAVRWRGETKTTTLHEDIGSVERVHCHAGMTRIVYHAEDAICGTCASGNLIGDAIVARQKYQCGACSTVGHGLIYDRRETDRGRRARGMEPLGKWEAMGTIGGPSASSA